MKRAATVVLLLVGLSAGAATNIFGTVTAKQGGTWSMLQSGSWSVTLLPTTAYVGKFRLTDGTLDVSMLNSAPASDTGQVAIPVRIISQLGAVGGTGTLTDAQLRASAVPVSGTFYQVTQPVSIAAAMPVTDNGGSLTVDGTFWQATQPVSGTFWQATQPVSIASMPSTPVTGTFWQATQPVSGPLTDTELRGSPVDVSGSVVDVTGSSVTVSGSVDVTDSFLLDSTFTARINTLGQKASAASTPVVLASDQSTLGTNTLFFNNSSTGMAGNGTVGTGTQRVTIASDSTGTMTVQPGNTANTTAWLMKVDQTGTNNDVDVATFPDNEPFNVAQIGGSAASTATTGVLKVGVVGSAGGAFDTTNNGALPANVILDAVEARSTQSTAATDGNARRLIGSTDGALFVREGGPVMWACSLNAIGATLTECKAAPASGLKLYVTDITVQTTTTTSGTYSLQYGTGSNCATGTTALFPASGTSNRFNAPITTQSASNFNFKIPLAPAAANAVCLIGVATNTISIQMQGFTAP